jgi:transcriptional regulator with XRE-family HTH domain
MPIKRNRYAITEDAPAWAKKTLRILRERGQSRHVLAELWGCAIPTVSRRLSGKLNVVAEDMRELAAFLNVDLESLLSDAETSPEPVVQSIPVRPMTNLRHSDGELSVDEALLDREPTPEELELMVARVDAVVDPTGRVWPPVPVGDGGLGVRVWGTSGMPEFAPGDIVIVGSELRPTSGDFALYQETDTSRPFIGRFVEVKRRRMLRPIEDGRWPTLNVPENPAVLHKIIAKVKIYEDWIE